jgi:hypothetical protein
MEVWTNAWMKRLIPFFSGMALDACGNWHFNSVRACRGEPLWDGLSGAKFWIRCSEIRATHPFAMKI